MSLLTWEGYADDSFVKPFEAETGCKVSATYVGSNDEFVAKILAGGGAYDLVSPSNDTTMRLIDAGLASQGMHSRTRPVHLRELDAFRAAFFSNAGVPVRMLAAVDGHGFDMAAEIEQRLVAAYRVNPSQAI